MLSLYGPIQPEDVIGHSPFEFIAPEDHARARLNIQNVSKNNYTSYNQYTLVKKDGTKFTGEINSSLLRDASGKPRGTISVIRDITERKQAEKERDQLFEQVRASRERLRNLSRRLVEVQEVERRELVRKLHDEVGQNLTALSINLNIVHSQLPPETVTKTATRIDDSLKLVEETVERIRDVMAELRPPVLDDYGVTAALHWYGKQFSERTGIPTVLKVEELKPRLPLPVETALFRIAQEALMNVAKHAQAKNVTVRLEEFGESVQLNIADDGVGIDSEAHNQPGAKPEWGLINMRERAQAIGGQLSVETAPGKGTQIVVEVPRKH
jgi:two-component system sensor histidine kinase UhpB